jgi:hypothetical protein
VSYASAQGYTLDRRHSRRNSVAMRGPTGDQVIIACDDKSGDWSYFSVNDDQDNGTIIDFITHRRRLNLGAIRKELRPWAGLDPKSAHPSANLLRITTGYFLGGHVTLRGHSCDSGQ